MSLLAGDLRMLVNNIFEVDSYSSKMGDDKDIVVLSFTVEQLEPAKDLVTFIERGYPFVLDADASSGELSDGRYKVFVEIERNRRIHEQILEVLDGVGKLADVDNFKFRYYKSFKSIDANEASLLETIPKTKVEYETAVRERMVNNYANFFGRTFLESVKVSNDQITFEKKFAGPVTLTIKDFGTTHQVYDRLKGPIMLESKDISEVLFYTKYIGNYNITKIGSSLVFESQGHAVVLEK
jgi:hypothetical protein